jgi:hypothetical protein
VSNFSKGKHSKFISDRSGMEFPYSEMVREWNGSRVHISEFEPKQPQLEPKPHGADPQGLPNARPARTEPATEDFLPQDPFTTTSGSLTVSVAFENGDMSVDDFVRFRDVKSIVGGVNVETLQVSGMVLQGDLTSSATTITLDYTSDMPSAGFIVIEKLLTSDDTSDPLKVGTFQNEVVQYTGISGTDLTGCTRGTSAPFRGVTPPATIASSHKSGAKVFGAFKIVALTTRTENTGAMPATRTIQTGFNFSLANVAPQTETGGGFQCTIGPLNDRP